MKFLQLAKTKNLLSNFNLSVIADRECSVVDYAQNNKIDATVIKYKRDNNNELKELLEKTNPDIIVTTWAKIIDEELVKKYKGKMINLHYSLLPAFAGQMGTDPIKNAYKQNCQYVGVTCHYVSEEVDMGTIISQAIVKTDIPQEKAIQEIFKKGCLILLNSIMIASKKVIVKESENSNYEYSPKLIFDDNMFNSEFWRELSVL
jgi:phosphoribosylglycinamide formyltransferase-1